MIIVDFNNVVFPFVAGCHAYFEGWMNTSDSVFYKRIIDHVDKITHDLKSEYGDEVICCMEGRSWRKEYSPNYKANRKLTRDESKNKIGAFPFAEYDRRMREFTKLTQGTGSIEYSQINDFKFIYHGRCEGDDVVAIVAMRLGDSENQKHCIVSSDKDLLQLGFDQYTPKGAKIENKDDITAIHLAIYGDVSDNVAPITKPSDYLLHKKWYKDNGYKYPNLTKKLVEGFKSLTESERLSHPKYGERYAENIKLVDLTKIPTDIQNEVSEKFKKTLADINSVDDCYDNLSKLEKIRLKSNKLKIGKV